MRPRPRFVETACRRRKRNSNASGLERRKRAFYFGRFFVVIPRSLDAEFFSLPTPTPASRAKCGVGEEKEKQRVGRLNCNDFLH
jgi:hypothetical protein